MSNAFVFGIHQTGANLEPLEFEAITCSGDRLRAALRHAVKIDAVFRMHGVTLDAEDLANVRELDRLNWQKFKVHGYGLPDKAAAYSIDANTRPS